MKQKYLVFLLVNTWLINHLVAQNKYCDGFHAYQNSSIGNYNPNSYVISLEQVTVSENNKVLFNRPADGYSGGVNCGEEFRIANTVNTALELTLGGNYTISTSSSSAYSYFAYYGAFIDFNNDKDFLDPGEYLGTWQDANNGKFKVSQLQSFDVNIPCNAKTGATRLRIVCNYNGYPMNASYGCTSCSGAPFFGETLDININLLSPKPFVTDFTVPTTLYVKRPYNFVSENKGNHFNHYWDLNADGSIEQKGNSFTYTNPKLIWNQPGQKCIKLKTSTCLSSDSISKCFNVVIPPSIPSADFIADKVNPKLYDAITLYDISTYGPWKWQWEVYDSTTYASQGFYPSLSSGDIHPDPYSNGNDEFSQTPQFSFDYTGCYTIVLRAINDNGPSIPTVKKCYITVSLPDNFNLGYGTYGPYSNNFVETPSGKIADNGGPLFPYDNDQGMGSRSFLCIKPCNALKIKLHLTQLKFKDYGDVLSVWDGSADGGPGTTLLGTFTAGSKLPKTLIASSGSMFILFESDLNGTDSGFAGYYETETGPGASVTPNFTTSHSITRDVPVRFFNSTEKYTGIPIWSWYLDRQPVSNFGPGYCDLILSDLKPHELCLEINACSGKNKNCKTIQASLPDTLKKINFTVSHDRPKSNLDIVSLKPEAPCADRFEWVIYPQTYVLMNPPSSPSEFGNGWIKYKHLPGDSLPVPHLKFTGGGCYTITLKAWHSSDPARTYCTKTSWSALCVLDYCQPGTYVTSQDLGISEVRISKNLNLILSNPSDNRSTYQNFSGNKSTDLEFCQNYQLEILRKTNVNPWGLNVYFDWNSDGDFDDLNESASICSGSSLHSATYNFTVPDASEAYHGEVRMRVVSNYDKDSIRACGPNTSGETEDYTLMLNRNLSPPQMTLNGPDTIFTMPGVVYNEPGAKATDDVMGDISNSISIHNTGDFNTVGICKTYYTVCDCSDNCVSSERTIMVLESIEKPTLILNPGSTSCLEASRTNLPYQDPGAKAYKYLPFEDLTSSITTSGKVNTRLVGNYEITYDVSDQYGNKSSAIRKVCVTDSKAPVLIAPLDTNVQIGTPWIDPVSAWDAYDAFPKKEHYWYNNRALNILQRGNYMVTYYAVDSSGNRSAPLNLTFIVDDFIPPVIQLNTAEKIYHEVNKPYLSIPASVTDNFYSSSDITFYKTFDNVNFQKPGIYTEVFFAMDASGNQTYKTRYVEVKDMTAPRIYAESMQGCVGHDIWPLWKINVSDNFDPTDTLKTHIEIIYQNVNIWEEGIYNIVYRVTDRAGNISDDFTRIVVFKYPPGCKISSVDLNTPSKAFWNIFPNPGSGKFSLSLPDNAEYRMRICDASGRLIKIMVLPSGEHEVDLSDLAAGLYHISLTDQNSETIGTSRVLNILR